MELIIILGVAVVAIVLVQRGGGGINVSGTLSGRVIPPVQGSYLNPVPAVNSNPWASTGLAAAPKLITAAAAYGAANNQNTDGGGDGSGAGSSMGLISSAVGAVASIVGSLLAAHEARLKGATNENNAAMQVVPAFDSFLSKIVAMYNQGQIDAGTAAAALQSFDQSIYQQLRSLVGAPGTAWTDNPSACNSACTVSCCIYHYDLSPALMGVSNVLGFPTSGFATDYAKRLLISGRTVTVPKVYPSKYTSYTRALYTVTLN